MYNRTPWGMINARREAAEYKGNLSEMENKIKQALIILYSTNPDINKVIKILEEAINRKNQ
jgi:hypothetical protein